MASHVTGSKSDGGDRREDPEVRELGKKGVADSYVKKLLVLQM